MLDILYEKETLVFFLFSFFSTSLCVNRNYSRQEDREETIQYLPISFLFFFFPLFACGITLITRGHITFHGFASRKRIVKIALEIVAPYRKIT